jgi:hypothetical protein
MQPFPGADIWDIIYYTDAGIVKVNYDIIIIHVGTNNVCNHKLADFSYAYNVLITTVKRLANLNVVIILSAIIPRPLDNSANVVKSVNFQLQSICHKRAVKFVTTYKPFLKFGVPVCEFYSPICILHLNQSCNIKLTIVFVQVLAHC